MTTPEEAFEAPPAASRRLPPVPATLNPDGTSLVPDPTLASQLYGKGGYGDIRSGGALALDTLETTYLVEMLRLEATGTGGVLASFPDLMRRAQDLDPAFEIRYLVYRDLRQRGYVVRRGPPGLDFALLPRGGSYPKVPSRFWVVAISERTPFDLAQVRGLLDQALAAKKQLMIGVVDEESDLTFYKVRRVLPQGHQPVVKDRPAAVGSFLEDRVSVFEGPAVEAWGRREMFGSRVGERLELSLLEALFLEESGALTLTQGPKARPLPVATFRRRAQKVEPDLPLRMPVYRDLRSRGLIAKTGFKYGAHFRAYERDPETTHARFLLHVVPPEFRAPWPEVSRAVRLAQGVRKDFLLASVKDEAAPTYVHLERVRP